MILTAGQRLASTVCPTQVVVVRAPTTDLDLRCGGRPMVALVGAPVEPAADGPDPDWAAGTFLGKRYVDDAGELELLCSKAGTGSLSDGTTPLTIRGAKPLPASD